MNRFIFQLVALAGVLLAPAAYAQISCTREGLQAVQAGEGPRTGRAHYREPDRMTDLRDH